MMYQPKSVGKMADFETSTLYISLSSSLMFPYFCNDLVTGLELGSVPGKKLDFQLPLVCKLILLRRHCCHGLDVR